MSPEGQGFIHMHSARTWPSQYCVACSCLRYSALDNVEHHLPGGSRAGPQHQSLLAHGYLPLLASEWTVGPIAGELPSKDLQFLCAKQLTIMS